MNEFELIGPPPKLPPKLTKLEQTSEQTGKGHPYSIVDEIEAPTLKKLVKAYVSGHPHLEQDNSVLTQAHPLLFETFKPVRNTGDRSCLYHALSLTLTGTETCTDLIRLLTAMP